jgi:hypothetical protein
MLICRVAEQSVAFTNILVLLEPECFLSVAHHGCQCLFGDELFYYLLPLT